VGTLEGIKLDALGCCSFFLGNFLENSLQKPIGFRYAHPSTFTEMMLNLPPNPTPEEFEKLEPLVVQAILEETFGEIKPLKRANGDRPETGEFVRVSPGQYKGIFLPLTGSTRFAFEISSSDVNYIPLNPETLEPTGVGKDTDQFTDALELVSSKTREVVFHNGGIAALAKMYAELNE
jgi:hypothetical protein